MSVTALADWVGGLWGHAVVNPNHLLKSEQHMGRFKTAVTRVKNVALIDCLLSTLHFFNFCRWFDILLLAEPSLCCCEPTVVMRNFPGMPLYLDVDVDDGDMEGVDGEWQVSPRQSLVVSRATP